MAFFMKHTCCDYLPPAPHTPEEAREQIFVHQRIHHKDEPWYQFQVTMVEKEADVNDSSE